MDLDYWMGSTPDEMLDAGPSTYGVERAKRIVALFAEVTTRRNVDEFVSGFTEDCIVNFPPAVVVNGRQALKERMAAGAFGGERPGFVCKKRLRSISGNILGVVWFNEWTDPVTRKKRHTKGVEFWQMDGDRIARWDATASTWDADH